MRSVVLPAASQCLIWGAGGAVAGGEVGAAVGGAAGAGQVVADAIIGPNPVTACIAWGGAGLRASDLNPVGALAGCATGVTAYYAPDSPFAQCATWLAGSFLGAK